MMGPWGYGYGSPWGWIIMGLWMLFFFLLAVILIIYVIRKQPFRSGRTPSSMENPVEIAKMRYASGEISKEEFEQIKHDLHS